MLLAKGSPLYLGYLCLEWKVELSRVRIRSFARGIEEKTSSASTPKNKRSSSLALHISGVIFTYNEAKF